MGSMKYQFKLVVKDKMVIISLLLPIIMAVLVYILVHSDLTSAIEIRYGVIVDEIPYGYQEKLEEYGLVSSYPSLEALTTAINDTSTEEIGIVCKNNQIEVMLSGDETTLTKSIAAQMESLLKEDSDQIISKLDILERNNIFQDFKLPLIALTLITAIYMGCVFNTMNMVTEKEDGVKIIYDILPLNEFRYLVQKATLGLVGGILTAMITICILSPTNLASALLCIGIIIISSYIAAVLGLFIGEIAENTMIAIVYLKMILLLFIAVPFVGHMFLANDKVGKIVSYLLPSCVGFDALIASMR